MSTEVDNNNNNTTLNNNNNNNTTSSSGNSANSGNSNRISSNNDIFRLAAQKYKGSFVRGYCLETGICLLFFLLKNNRISKWTGSNILSIFISKNHLKIANSLGLASASYQLLLKKIFGLTENDKYNIIKHMSSSFIATFWLYYVTPTYRQRISTYFFMRSCYDFYKYIQNEPEFEQYPLLTFPKHIKHGEFYVFSCLAGCIAYGLCHDPKLFDPGYYKIALKHSRNTDEQFRKVFRSPSDPTSIVKLPHEPFVPCIPHIHEEPSCFKFHSRNFVESTLIFSKMYGIVHCAPLLLSKKFYTLLKAAVLNEKIKVMSPRTKIPSRKPPKLITKTIKEETKEEAGAAGSTNDSNTSNNDNNNNNNSTSFKFNSSNNKQTNRPVHRETRRNARIALLQLAKRKFIATFRSSLFFSTLQHVFKLLQCYVRYLTESDYPLLTASYCMISAIPAFMCETKHRRVEYTIYTGTQVFIMFGRWIRRNYPKFFKLFIKDTWSMFLLQCCFIIWSLLQAVKCDHKYIGRLNTFVMKMVL